jgi:hypothetical protein
MVTLLAVRTATTRRRRAPHVDGGDDKARRTQALVPERRRLVAKTVLPMARAGTARTDGALLIE